jgi:hypothetical protein
VPNLGALEAAPEAGMVASMMTSTPASFSTGVIVASDPIRGKSGGHPA